MSVPAWCSSTRGNSALLLVAPHGGRRPAVDATAPPPRLRVNDVYTAELTALLAARLDAATVINHAQDRNSLDLNRTSQVLRCAPWFLELLVRQIEAILVRHPVAEVLFIHGWNVGQPKCDLGIGAVETATGLHLPDGAALTVADTYLQQRLEPLRAAAAATGIGVSIGERYPASHRNNLLQLFTSRAADHAAAQRLADWARAGRLNALQLELGIPLRWPGTWRDRLVEAITASFSEPATSRLGKPLTTQDSALSTDQPEPNIDNPVAAALQFYDPAADVGLFAGLGPMGPAVTGGRLLLFLGHQRIALFTGEHVGGGQVAPLEFRVENGCTRLRFHGALLRLEDARVYLDLEAALAQSELVDADVELVFAPMHAGNAMQFGSVDGTLRIADEHRRISTGAFANAGGLRATGSRRQTMLAADFGDGRGLLLRSTDEAERSMALSFAREGMQVLEPAPVVVSLDGDLYTPQRFERISAGQPALRAQPWSRMPILRPTGRGGYVRVTFGVARFEWGAETGWGLYEHAVPLLRGEHGAGAAAS